MNDKSIVFEKARKLFLGGGFDEKKYYFTFSPFAIEFTNQDFNFLSGETKDANAARDDYNDKWTFARLANTINRNQHIWNLLQDERIFDEARYGLVLQKAIKIDAALTEEEKLAYGQARKVLYKDADSGTFDKTDEYNKYQDFAGKVAAVNASIDAKNQERKSMDNSNAAAITKWQQELDELNNQVNILKTDWKIQGFREVIDNALRTISKANDKENFVTSWSQHVNEFNNLVKENNPVSNIDFLPTFCNPTDIYQPDYAGWRKVVIEEDELKTLDAEAKAFLGDEVYNSFDSIGVTFNRIEFDILFVDIARSWLRKDLLESRYWKFPAEITDQLSSGDDSNTGIIPSYPSQLVFIRHLKYTSPESADQPVTTQMNAVKKYVFKDMVAAQLPGTVKKAVAVKYQLPKITNLFRGRPLIFLKPNNGAASTVTVVDHRRAATAGGHSTVVAGRSRGGFVWVKDHWERKKAQPDPPALCTLTIIISDSKNNVLPNVDIHLKAQKTGANYEGDTTSEGKLVVSALEPDNYSIDIYDEEFFEDYHEVFSVKSDVNKPVVLTNRKAPKIKFSLLGVVNCRLPKLPDPIEGAIYS